MTTDRYDIYTSALDNRRWHHVGESRAKPQSLSVRDRILERQELALEAIRLSHEKEDYRPCEPLEYPLPTDDILRASYPSCAVNISQEPPLWRRLLRWVKGY